jgi:cysteine desulfuration protein SufE
MRLIRAIRDILPEAAIIEGMNRLPGRLQEIVEDFALVEGREKLEYLLDFAESLPPLPSWLEEQRDRMDQVHECMTPVFIHAEQGDGKLRFHFDVPPEAPTVRGYAAVLAEGLRDVTAQEVMQVPGDFYLAMGLQEVLTGQRLNGIGAILAHMKQLVQSQT